jgi:hypothetical protein
LAATISACDDRERGAPDATTMFDGGVDAFSPAPPVFEPCPLGWRATDDEVPTCEPWTEPRPAPCTGAMGRFAGDDACVSPGAACPSGEFQEDDVLPRWAAFPRRLYVRAGATGGVGSAAAPFGTIAQAVAAATGDTLVLLGAGTYDETVRLSGGVFLWGACPERTTLVTSEPREGTGIVNFIEGHAGLGNVRLGPSPRPGMIAAGPGVVAEVVGVAVTGAESAGVFVTQEAELHAFNLLVADTRSRPSDGWIGRGIDVTESGYLTIEHGVLRANQDTGLSVLDNGTRVELTDVVIRDTIGRESDGWFGRGLVAEGASSVSGTEVVLLNNRDTALAVARDAIVALDQLIARGTESGADGLTGRGIAVQGATFRGNRVLIDASRDTGLIGLSPSQIEVSHLVIRDTIGRSLDNAFGRGMIATAGANIEADHVLIQRSREVGVTVDDGSTATLRDVVVEDSLAADCAPGCEDSFGIGVSSFGVSELVLERFRVLRSDLAAVQIGDPPPGPAATITLVDGEIADAPIGVNLQPTSYDFATLTTSVSIARVERIIDAAFLPLPRLDP